MAKRRLDVAVTELGLTESRQKAQALIMAGEVYVNGQKQLKAGTSVEEDDVVEVREKRPFRYVSRGGLKLEKAMELWPIALEGRVCADIGASTGGFTDCMLQNGAKLVYAVDVGYNQLDWKLRTHPQVVCMERTNARYLTKEQIPEPLDFFSVDVSFISLNLILPALRPLIREGGQAVCLVLLNMMFFQGEYLPVEVFEHTLELQTQGFALLALIPIWLYGGERGRGGRALQYGSYVFYPLHMLALYLIVSAA